MSIAMHKGRVSRSDFHVLLPQEKYNRAKISTLGSVCHGSGYGTRTLGHRNTRIRQVRQNKTQKKSLPLNKAYTLVYVCFDLTLV